MSIYFIVSSSQLKSSNCSFEQIKHMCFKVYLNKLKYLVLYGSVSLISVYTLVFCVPGYFYLLLNILFKHVYC